MRLLLAMILTIAFAGCSTAARCAAALLALGAGTVATVACGVSTGHEFPTPTDRERFERRGCAWVGCGATLD